MEVSISIPGTSAEVGLSETVEGKSGQSTACHHNRLHVGIIDLNSANANHKASKDRVGWLASGILDPLIFPEVKGVCKVEGSQEPL